MPRIPTITDTYLNATKSERERLNPGGTEKNASGFANGPMLSAKPQLTVTPAEKVIDGESNAVIIIGRDRPGSRATGLGAKGRWTGASRIDLIAGLNGVCAKETDERGNPIATNPSPYLDSARIYMTQQAADIDSEEYFNIVKGKVGTVKNEPAIAIKADSIRIIGRQGVKIVTGTDKYSAGAGWFIGEQVRGIDLIAGNDDRDLQPLVKGNDLYELLIRQQDLTQELMGFIDFQLKLLLTYMASQSVVPEIKAAGTTKLIGMMISLVPHVLGMNVWTLKSIFHKLNFDDDNPFAFYNFKSKFNHTN